MYLTHNIGSASALPVIKPMGPVRIRHRSHEFGWQSVILWISLGGKPKWLPLKFGYHDVIRTSPISTGLPQGSHLGPVLFINDLPSHTKPVATELYADDAVLHQLLPQMRRIFSHATSECGRGSRKLGTVMARTIRQRKNNNDDFFTKYFS